MEEIWKDIEGYKGYQVSNFGRVRTFNKTTYTERHGIRHWKNRILKERLGRGNNELSVQLYKNGKGKSFTIHRLVGYAFLGKPEDEKMTINHKDGNRRNNNVDNLEWLSLKDNIRHGFINDLYHNQIKIEITNKATQKKTIFRSMAEASRKINKNNKYISCMLKRNIYENNFYKWKIVN